MEENSVEKSSGGTIFELQLSEEDSDNSWIPVQAYLPNEETGSTVPRSRNGVPCLISLQDNYILKKKQNKIIKRNLKKLVQVTIAEDTSGHHVQILKYKLHRQK